VTPVIVGDWKRWSSSAPSICRECDWGEPIDDVQALVGVSRNAPSMFHVGWRRDRRLSDGDAVNKRASHVAAGVLSDSALSSYGARRADKHDVTLGGRSIHPWWGSCHHAQVSLSLPLRQPCLNWAQMTGSHNVQSARSVGPPIITNGNGEGLARNEGRTGRRTRNDSRAL